MEMTEKEYQENLKKCKNKAKCRKCGDIVESKHVHDFVACGCGAIFVDGGNQYWRWGGTPEDFERVWEER